MAFYRTDNANGTTNLVHMRFGNRLDPAACSLPDFDYPMEPCRRIVEALCDYRIGETIGGTPLTCDRSMCKRHRTRVGDNRDYCPVHAEKTKAERTQE